MEIDRHLNGHDLLSDDFFIADPGDASRITVVKRPRIGVDYARHWTKRLLRFYIKGNACVSRP
jgi:DNA-3-methyladenine glycosylase